MRRLRMFHLVFQHVAVEKNVADAQNHHDDAPELRRGKRAEESAAVVAACEFDAEPPHAVRDEI